MNNEQAINLLKNLRKSAVMRDGDVVALDMAIKALKQEPLTDKEQRIFLAAMGREEKVCKDVDEEHPCREPYEDTLVSVCKSIKRKVKKALWE